MKNDLKRVGMKPLAAALIIVLILCIIAGYLAMGIVIVFGLSIFFAIRSAQSPYEVVIDQDGILCRRRYLKDRSFVWSEIHSIYFFRKGKGHAVIWIKNSTKQVQVSVEVGKAVLDKYAKATGKQLYNESVD